MNRAKVLRFIACFTRFSLMDLKPYDDGKLVLILNTLSRDPLVGEDARRFAEDALDSSEWRSA